MILPPEKHLEIAAAFQALADDETQPEAQRAEDARKAAFWRWLAGRAESTTLWETPLYRERPASR